MSKAMVCAALIGIGSLTACDFVERTSKSNFGASNDVPMISSNGVSAGASSTDLIRNGRAASVATKSYRVGASDFADEMVVTSTVPTANFNSYQNAFEIRLPYGKDETAQVAARIADNLGLNATVADGSIVLVPATSDASGAGVLANRGMAFAPETDSFTQAQLSECYLKLGSCKTDVSLNGRSVPVLVQTGNQNGLWYQSVRTADTGFLRRSKLLSHTVFSVDNSATLKDLNTVSYVAKEPVMQYVRRVK